MTVRLGAYSPLPIIWKHPLQEVGREIRIIEKPSFCEADWDFWNLRRTERTETLERDHWLCLEQECEYHEREFVLGRLHSYIQHAMLGFQLWLPKGWDGLTILAEIRNGIYPERVSFPEPYARPKWGRVLSAEKSNPDELRPLVEGTIRAFESQSVAVLNPFQFLEIGLQTAFNHENGGALFWTFGLDGLLGGAGGQDVFAARANRLLGPDTKVFPEDSAGRCPVYTVSDMAKEIFALRNQLSHGLTILEKHRKKIEFKFEPAELSFLHVEDWTQRTLIVESALFTLLAALRKIITAGYMDRMKDQRLWGRWLDSPV